MNELQPRLIATDVPDRPAGLVLVLHGGGSRRHRAMVSPAQLSVLRMVPIARVLARRGSGRLAVFRLLNSVRGWDSTFTPVKDVRWALDRLQQRFGELPVGLVGHSLGGRAALLATDEPGVQSTVALAPWLYEQEPVRHSAGPILFVHGDADRVASPARSAAYARQLGRSGNRVGELVIGGGKHAMLSRHADFSGAAADFTVATLLGDRPRTLPPELADPPVGFTNATV